MLDKILNIIDSVNTTDGWRPKITRTELVVVDPMPGLDVMFTFRIEPKGAKLKKVIQDMTAESPKYKKIFGNLPTSRSKLLKILTNRQSGDSTELANAKAAAIKAFYRAQQPLLDAIRTELKSAYPGKDFIFNPIEFKYSGAGDTVWEGYMHSISDKPTVPPSPPEAPEDISIVTPKPESPAQPPPAAAEEEMVKVEKHILKRPEIDSIIDGLVRKLGLNPNTDLVVINNSAKALSEYEDMRIGSVLMEVPTVEVSDSYNSRNADKEVLDDNSGIKFKMPNVVAYIQTTKGRVVKSRDEWMKLMQGRSPIAGQRFKNYDDGIVKYSKKSSRYGAPIAKEIRRKQNDTRTYDEIAVYADIKPATNRFTGKARKWGGEVRYTFFIIIPKEVYVPKSKLRK
jgi:hypothetical protein